MVALKRKAIDACAFLLLSAAMFILWVASIIGAAFAVALPFMLVGAAGYGIYAGFCGMRWLAGYIGALLGSGL